MGVDYQEKEYKELFTTPIQIDKSIHQKFKEWCVVNQIGIGEKAEELIANFLGEQNANN